jgi:hypothetical protein
MKIPTSFQLIDQTIKVIFDDRLVIDHDCHGRVNYDLNEILLSPDSKEFPWSEDQQNHAFLHELTHFIFKRSGEDKLSKNERVVNLFSRLLYQALKTMETK